MILCIGLSYYYLVLFIIYPIVISKFNEYPKHMQILNTLLV